MLKWRGLFGRVRHGPLRGRMRRRDFSALLGGAALALAWPLAARGQQTKLHRIGALLLGNADAESFRAELREGLRNSAYVEGHNLVFDFRSAEGKIDLLPKLAAELVALRVDVIVALYTPCALAAQQATREIPIVVVSGDPLGTGLVTSLARPGGASLSTKTVAELALKHGLPAATQTRSFAEVGGLLSYGADGPDVFRRAALFVTKILQGGHPANMPVEQPTRFELVVNLRVAKALGITVPESFLLRADQVIE